MFGDAKSSIFILGIVGLGFELQQLCWLQLTSSLALYLE